MRSFILSLSAKYQMFLIVFSTVLIAFISSISIYLIFGSDELIPKSGLITGIYTVLGTMYAVLVAFAVSGVWQNYCASGLSVSKEVAALTDLVHMTRAFTTERAAGIGDDAVAYLKEVVADEWPALAKGQSDLIILPQSKTFALTMKLIQAVQAIQPVSERDNIIFSQVLTLLNKWLDARRMRIMVSKGNIAKSLWPFLIAGAFILFAFHGLFIVDNHLLWATLLFLFSGIVGLSFYLIFTLDCPYAGSPAVESAPFNWAIVWLEQEKALGKNN